jgi:hypothetical protein
LIFCDDADRFWYRTSIKEKKYGVFFTERAGALLLCIKIMGKTHVYRKQYTGQKRKSNNIKHYCLKG